MKLDGTVCPACANTIRLMAHQLEENDALRRRLEQFEGGLRDLRGIVETLNCDLDESRRLNLRAAEPMDVAFSELAK